MHWAKKRQRINPIASSVEIKLLTRAYKTQPRNPRLFSKLIEALVLENQLSNAIELCEQHLKTYNQDDNVYAVLTYLYRKTYNIDALIQTGESALRHSPKLETQLQLAYAYADKGSYQQAAKALPSVNDYLALTANHLKLLFETHLRIGQAEEVGNIYHALPLFRQEDSGLKSCYIKALHQLDRQAEIESMISHQTLISQHHLPEPAGQVNISELNQQLTSFFLSHPQQHYEPGNHTTRNGSQLYFESHWHPSLGDLEIRVKQSVECYFHAHEAYRIESDHSFSLNLWANIVGKKGYQISHMHPEALLSGVYYVRVPASISRASQSDNKQGFLLFSQAETILTHYVQPSEGLIVLFPSYFYHQTLPLEHDETRICVAFDVIYERRNKLAVL
jgi:uncharacterized protein (TIGR02466 family)